MSSQSAEPHYQNQTSRLNQLRAAVLGANDGIVSIAGLVVGVAGAANNQTTILTAGVAGILAGALSMAAGEYVSVSSQRDTEQSLLQKEKLEIETYPQRELAELTQIYINKGLSPHTATLVAQELTTKDAYLAHLDAELAIDPNHLVSPWQAAIASALSFLTGSLLPLVAILLPPPHLRIGITFASTIVALIITGALSAKFGQAPVIRAILRVTFGGIVAMVVTYTIGHLLGTHAF